MDDKVRDQQMSILDREVVEAEAEEMVEHLYFSIGFLQHLEQ